MWSKLFAASAAAGATVLPVSPPALAAAFALAVLPEVSIAGIDPIAAMAGCHRSRRA